MLFKLNNRPDNCNKLVPRNLPLSLRNLTYSLTVLSHINQGWKCEFQCLFWCNQPLKLTAFISQAYARSNHFSIENESQQQQVRFLRIGKRQALIKKAFFFVLRALRSR